MRPFLEAVRDRHPSTVRILLTGYADIQSTVAAINRGEIHRYIAKPWDDQDMLLVVSDALKRRDLGWQSPVWGAAPAEEFVPIAERSGLIVAIGDWVIRQVCGQIKCWRAAGLPPIRVSINLSPVQ